MAKCFPFLGQDRLRRKLYFFCYRALGVNRLAEVLPLDSPAQIPLPPRKDDNLPNIPSY